MSQSTVIAIEASRVCPSQRTRSRSTDWTSGTDVAIESAGVTLLKGDLMGIVRARRLSQATMSNIRQNLVFAFIYNVLGIPLAALGMLNPVIAGAAMAMSSVSVVSNSLLLKRWKARVE